MLADNGKLKFHTSGNAGLNFNYFVNEQHGMYIDFSMQPTKVDIWQTDYSNDLTTVDMNVAWYQLGYIYKPNLTKKLKPFVGFSLGSTIFNAKDDVLSTGAVFSITGFGGINYELTDVFGLQLNGKFLYPAGIGKNIEYQSAIGGNPVIFNNKLVQGSINLGVYFKIDGKK
jgi:hypothetical protein